MNPVSLSKDAKKSKLKSNIFYDTAVAKLYQQSISKRMLGQWRNAGDLLMQCGDLQLFLKMSLEAATMYTEAAETYMKLDKAEGLIAYEKAIKVYCDVGRFDIAGRLERRIAQSNYDSKHWEDAALHYRKAANFLSGEKLLDQSDICMEKSAECVLRMSLGTGLLANVGKKAIDLADERELAESEAAAVAAAAAAAAGPGNRPTSPTNKQQQQLQQQENAGVSKSPKNKKSKKHNMNAAAFVRSFGNEGELSSIREAGKIYEMIARSCVTTNLRMFNARDYLLKALFCEIAMPHDPLETIGSSSLSGGSAYTFPRANSNDSGGDASSITATAAGLLAANEKSVDGGRTNSIATDISVTAAGLGAAKQSSFQGGANNSALGGGKKSTQEATGGRNNIDGRNWTSWVASDAGGDAGGGMGSRNNSFASASSSLGGSNTVGGGAAAAASGAGFSGFGGENGSSSFSSGNHPGSFDTYKKKYRQLLVKIKSYESVDRTLWKGSKEALFMKNLAKACLAVDVHDFIDQLYHWEGAHSMTAFELQLVQVPLFEIKNYEDYQREVGAYVKRQRELREEAEAAEIARMKKELGM